MEELLDFLKKYSDIDVEFIRDFIRIRQGDKTHDPFRIDLDIMTKWLNSRKADLKSTLLVSYIENIDYILLRVPPEEVNRKHGGHNKEIILLTEDCFKLMCLRSNTKTAEKIRYYYLTLEKLVEIYKDDIIKNQQEKIDKLKRNLKKEKFPVKGAIYVIGIEDGYRIGKTHDLNKRYKLYESAHKDKPQIKYVFYSNDIDRLENCIKNLLRYDEYRNRKEFYLVELSDIIDAIQICDDVITKFKCKSCNKLEKIKTLGTHNSLCSFRFAQLASSHFVGLLTNLFNKPIKCELAS